MRHVAGKCILLAILAVLSSGPVYAQATHARTTGEITVDPQDAVNEQFRGVGFHVFCHLHKMTQRQVNRVFAKRWRELNPAFARVTHVWNWDLKNVLPHLRRMQRTDTEVYLTTWNPKDTKPGEARADYAQRVVEVIERLVRQENLSNIEYYCMTNELSLNGWASMKDNLPKFRDYHRHIYDELQRRKLDVGLLATDASPIGNWSTIQWAADNMDEITAVYGGHHYINNHGLDDLNFYPWFLKKVKWGTSIARGKDKPFIVGEFGPKQHRGARYGYDRWDGCYYWNRPSEPLVGIQVAEAIIAMINGGVRGMSYWTFADFPDDYRKTYANKWGVFRWSGNDHSTRAHYYAVGLLTRFFRGPATACRVESPDELLRAAAVRRTKDGAWSIAVVNRHETPSEVNVRIPGLRGNPAFRKYVYNPRDIPFHPYGDLQPPQKKVTVREGTLSDTISGQSLVVYTTAFDRNPPGRITGLKVQSEGKGANRLTWNPSRAEDFCYYRVYRSTTSRFPTTVEKQIGSTVAEHFVDENAEADADYYYCVVAVDQSGNAGKRSKQ